MARKDDGPVRILLVEDNDTVREAFKDTLELLNYEVEAAQDGRDALARIQELKTRFDLVISDLVMPNMNGLQLYDALNQIQEDVRMLIITGYPMPNTGKTLAERSGVNWTRKPVRMEELSRLVRELTQ